MGVWYARSWPQAAASTTGGVTTELCAVCPHLGAVVTWNDFERSWDRPAGRRLATMSNRPGAKKPGTPKSGPKNSGAVANRYGAPTLRRTALAPGLLAAIVLIAGFALIEGSGFIVIQYVVAILALIIAWFALQAKQWWWIPLLVAIAVIWNPVVPFRFSGPYWFGAQYAAILVFVLVAIFVKVPITEAQKPGRVR
ncbi:hypothetical protein BH10ACT6_BH10ACT6_10340 [soil metagenome]